MVKWIFCTACLAGMELFEEALRSWEQALSFRSRQAEDEVSCGSIQTAAAMAAAPATEDTVEVRGSTPHTHPHPTHIHIQHTSTPNTHRRQWR